jgi:mono/diheme cytochrome c family protein
MPAVLSLLIVIFYRNRNALACKRITSSVDPECRNGKRRNVRGFIVGVIVTVLLIVVGGYLFVRGGGVSLATTAAPLPMEAKMAHMALRASIGNAANEKDPLSPGDENLLSVVKTYKENCAVCHGAPAHPPSMISKGMFPPPPQLFEKADMVTDDPEGETYWKVTHGIRLSGMPGFGAALNDTQRWQVTMLLKNADKLPASAQAAFAGETAIPSPALH